MTMTEAKTLKAGDRVVYNPANLPQYSKRAEGHVIGLHEYGIDFLWEGMNRRGTGLYTCGDAAFRLVERVS